MRLPARPGVALAGILAALLVTSITVPAAAHDSSADHPLVLDPDCAPSSDDTSDPYEITVRGFGFDPGLRIEIFFGPPGNKLAGGSTTADGDGNFETIIEVGPEEPGPYEVVAEQVEYTSGTYQSPPQRLVLHANDAPFEVPCPPPSTETTETTTTEPRTPTDTTTTTSTDTTSPPTTLPPEEGFAPVLFFDPPLGPGGFVTILVGQGFPPNGGVNLNWALTSGAFSVATDDGGSFRVPVLIFYGDPLGPHNLEASGIGFAPVTAAFLVTPGTFQPGGFDPVTLLARR